MRAAVATWAIALVASFPAFGSDFTYKVPDGFLELPTATHAGDPKATNVPPQLLKDAKNGRYVLVAVDPDLTTTNSVGATFNVVEMKSTGHMTKELARKVADATAQGFSSSGLHATVVDVSIVKMNNVDTSVTTMDIQDNAGVRRMRQYVLPGRNGSAVLSYSAPRGDFERFYPAFLRSLNATTGVSEPPTEPRRFNWTEFFLAGLLGGLLGVGWWATKKFALDKDKDGEAGKEVAPAAALAPAKKEVAKRATKYTWICEECGNPVPIRLEQCRCGGKKTRLTPYRKTMRRLLQLAALAALALPLSAPALLIRADREDAEYVEMATKYTSAVSIDVPGGGEGVLIDKRWVLTSARVGVALKSMKAPPAIRFGTRDVKIQAVYVHPAWRPDSNSADLALIYLARNAGIDATEVYRKDDEAGFTVVIAAHGDTAKIGERSARQDHKARAGINTIDRLSPRVFAMELKGPETASDLQAAFTASETGCPAYYQAESKELFVVGIASSSRDANSNGTVDIGDSQIFVRVSAYARWIDETIQQAYKDEVNDLFDGKNHS